MNDLPLEIIEEILKNVPRNTLPKVSTIRLFRPTSLRLFFRRYELRRPFQVFSQFEPDLYRLTKSPFFAQIKVIVLIGYEDWRYWCRDEEEETSKREEVRLACGMPLIFAYLPTPTTRQSVIRRATFRSKRQLEIEAWANIFDAIAISTLCSIFFFVSNDGCREEGPLFWIVPVTLLAIFGRGKARLIFSAVFLFMSCTYLTLCIALSHGPPVSLYKPV